MILQLEPEEVVYVSGGGLQEEAHPACGVDGGARDDMVKARYSLWKG